MTYKLYLDDVRNPPDNTWILARSYDEATDLVCQRGIPEFVSFDHDLADEHYGYPNGASHLEKTGYHFAMFLIELDRSGEMPWPDNFDYAIHSMNPSGRKRIKDAFEDYFRSLADSGK